jgi:serine/tyrosine/threonine adenylyltransferase
MSTMKNLKLNCDILNVLDDILYTLTKSSPLENPRIISVNKILAQEMKIEDEILDSEDFKNFINGEYICEGSTPYANAYAGHQFGHPVAQLGDGRALSLGKLNEYQLQLKGSGSTVYSRRGDGRAVLRSSIREYLMGEAMHGLGIPTSRALGIISSDTQVFREYEYEKGSIVLRVAKSWIRFGSFEYAYYSKNKNKNITDLANHVIDESYPHLKKSKNKYEELYFAIVDKTVLLMALWQSVGFMHGVMNTDNMSIDGLTIDYGPYAFMENFEAKSICNTSDHEGRYCYENQPYIGQWNLSVLAKTFSVIADETIMKNYNDTFIEKYKEKYFDIMSKKLGLGTLLEDDYKLISELLDFLEKAEIDYTPFFYYLSCDNKYEIKKLCTQEEDLDKWFISYETRLTQEYLSKKERLKQMRKINPKYVLKNYILQEAIELAEKDDFSLVNSLLEIAQNPYDEHIEFERYSLKTPKVGQNIICSCSS